MTAGKIVTHRRAPDWDVFIGAPSQWQNPYRDGDTQDESKNLDQYEAYLRRTPRLMAIIDHLAGKTLACTCPADKCHGNVLLKLAAEKAGQADPEDYAEGDWPARQVAPPETGLASAGAGVIITPKTLDALADNFYGAYAGPPPKPCIKAAGGKAKLIPQLAPFFPSPQTYHTYVEPFFGGGAVFFHQVPGLFGDVYRQPGERKQAHLGDVNADLINLYQTIKSDAEALMAQIDELGKDISPEAYYAARSMWNESKADLSLLEQAALFVYFNKLGFNGLWRVNASGKMNNPAGTLAKRAKTASSAASGRGGKLYDRDNLLAVSRSLQYATLTAGSYMQLFEQHAKLGAWFFLDPPYLGTYDGYSAEGFTESDHVMLAESCRWLDEQGAHFMLTHADHPTIRELYQGFRFEEVTAKRSGSGKAKGRGDVGEIVVRNYLLSDLLHVVGVSGGKDSTALALRLAEVEPRDYTYLITPTGDELPDMVEHWARLEKLLGKPFVRVTNGTLKELIHTFGSLPNWRQRWCTRILKIEPTIAYLLRHAPAVQYVGLRADEETREGIYGDMVQSRFPLREWGWGITEVKGYLKERGIEIPPRTDCARCYDQRLVEWKRLLVKHPAIYADAEQDEKATGHTFRGPGRDTWPAPLKDLRVVFESGRKVRGEDSEPSEEGACRVCKL